MTTTSSDQRFFSRIPFDASATIVGPDKSWQTELVDVSLKGALVSRPADWDAEPTLRHFLLKIALSEEATVNMEVEIAHEEGNHIGFHCHNIDVDSISHLRRIVELNLGDEEMLQRELHALGEHR